MVCFKGQGFDIGPNTYAGLKNDAVNKDLVYYPIVETLNHIGNRFPNNLFVLGVFDCIELTSLPARTDTF